MRKRGHELETDANVSREVDVFYQNRHAGADDPFTEANVEYDFRVDFLGLLARRNITDIARSETESPIHNYDVLFGARPSSNFLDSWRLGAECESAEADRIDSLRCVYRQNLVD